MKLGMQSLLYVGPNQVYFRKAGHACSFNKKKYISVNLEQFEDETPLNSMQILHF